MDPRYQAVETSARALIEGGPRPAIPTGGEPERFSRRMIIGSSVVAAAAASFGGWLFFRPPLPASGESIAVLPFENLSGDPKQAYFSEGMAEELRDDLSRIAGLRVVARGSSEAVGRDEVTVANEAEGREHPHRLGPPLARDDPRERAANRRQGWPGALVANL